MITPNLTIINYHKIESDSDIGITARHPKDFIDDINCILHHGYTSINFNDLKTKNPLPDKPIIITFDDAYLSFYKYAYDVLESFKIKAVVFVPVNYIGKTNNWDVQIFKKKYMHMNEQQLGEISEHGFELGSHTLSHRLLTYLDINNLKYEFEKSKNILEEISGKEILSVSYPFGRVNLKVLKIAKKFFSYGVSLMHSKKYDHQYLNYTLKRINIYRNDTRRQFIKKLEFNKYPGVKIRSQLIQYGAWATILLQKAKSN